MKKLRNLLPLLAILLVVGPSCSSKDETVDAPLPVYVPPVADEQQQVPPVRFEAHELPMTHTHGGTGKRFMPEPMGPGVTLLDYDGDGDLDLFFTNGREFEGEEPLDAAQILLRNDGGLKFSDVSKSAGVDLHIYGQGACAADYDGDGDTDLFITAVDGQRLLRNEGGRFTDVTNKAGLSAPTWTDSRGIEHAYWSTGATWVDVDADGLLDLFVGNYVRWSVENDLFTTIDGKNKSFTTPEKYPGLSNLLYRNTGDGRFEDITKQAGVFNPAGKSLGVTTADFNDDGKIDVVVANDTQPNYLYINAGGGTFTERGMAAGIALDEAGRARAGMGIDVADLGNDGLPVVAIGNFSKEPISLFSATEGGFFTDRSGAMRLSGPSLRPLTFGVLFVDYDLDGRQDLVAANGHLEPSIGDITSELNYAQKPQLFWNAGSEFVSAGTNAGQVFDKAIVARSIASGDLDGDGDPDLILTINGGKALLLEHKGSKNHWLRVRLQKAGAKGTTIIGARVQVRAGELSQTRWIRAGGSYLSQSELMPTFGLGTHSGAVEVEVRWPDGSSQKQQVESVDREIPVIYSAP